MLSRLFSLSLYGLSGDIVEVEVDLHRGMPKFAIVGLGDTAIQESKERVRSACKNSGYLFPPGVLSVNLAPADLKKHGPRFDVPIALGILEATGQITFLEDRRKILLVGELAFTGELRPIMGMLPTVSEAKAKGFTSIIVPQENAEEASFIPEMQVYGAKNLQQIVEHVSGQQKLEPCPPKPFSTTIEEINPDWDMCHIRGNEHGKRALEIAAAGGHNILLCGPPGSGKTMLAQSVSTILPGLSVEEALDITKIYSISGMTSEKVSVITKRPFRTIHHTASSIALVGGSNPPRPGEISLAHRGILFLDEFPEFPTKTLEVLRQPLEDGMVTISRASGSCHYPAKVMLVAAMNPTPCGYDIDDPKCTSTASEIQKYQNKISGPLLDRIDLHVPVPRVDFEKLKSLQKGEPSATIRKRVQAARDLQKDRFEGSATHTNAEMSSQQVKKYCALDEESNTLVKSAMDQFDLSGRAYFRILKVARTIADLEGLQDVGVKHIAEAIQYRQTTLLE